MIKAFPSFTYKIFGFPLSRAKSFAKLQRILSPVDIGRTILAGGKEGKTFIVFTGTSIEVFVVGLSDVFGARSRRNDERTSLVPRLINCSILLLTGVAVVEIRAGEIRIGIFISIGRSQRGKSERAIVI